MENRIVSSDEARNRNRYCNELFSEYIGMKHLKLVAFVQIINALPHKVQSIVNHLNRPSNKPNSEQKWRKRYLSDDMFKICPILFKIE
jgi:hypothetical protein